MEYLNYDPSRRGLRDAAYDPRRLDHYLDQIEKIDPQKLEEYEKMTGIALARANLDFSKIQQSNVNAEERHLMPKHNKVISELMPVFSMP